MQRRAFSLTAASALAVSTLGLGLPELLRLGEGEARSGGKRRPSILADAVEAILGAVYLEAGFPVAEQVVHQLFAKVDITPQMQAVGKDPKTALQEWLQCVAFAQTDPRADWPLAQFDAAIEHNKRDFDTRFAKAQLLAAAGQWTDSMDELLEIILRDKTWNEQAARKLFIAILELLTPPKPKKQDAVPGKTAGGIELLGKNAAQQDTVTQLINSYRRKLSMALN